MSIFRKHSVWFNYMMNFGLKVSGALCTAIGYPYAFRILGADRVGKVAFATSVLSFFTMLATLGIPVYGVRECARVRENRTLLTETVHELLTIQLIMTLISTTLLLTATYCIPRLRNDAVLFWIQAGVLLIGAFNTDWLYTGLEQYGFITLRSASIKVLVLFLIFLLIRAADDYITYAVLLGLGNVLPYLLNLMMAGRLISSRKSSSPYACKRHIRPILVFFAQAAAITVYTSLDSAMLGFISGDYWVGIYDAPVKIKLICSYFITSLGTVLLPRLSNYIHTGRKEEFRKEIAGSAEFTLLTGLPLTVFLIVMAPECIEFLFGAEFLPSAAVLRILAPTVFLIGCSNLTGTQILTPFGKERVVLWSVVAGAGVDMIMNLLLIPRYAASGAAMGTLVAEIVVLSIQIFCLRSELQQILRVTSVGRIILSASLSCLTLLWSKWIFPSVLMAKLLIGAVLYFGFVTAMLYFLKEPLIFAAVRSIRQYLRKSR